MGTQPRNNETAATRTEKHWSTGVRWLVTGWLCLHLSALVAAPMAGPPPASDLSRSVASKLEWYIRPLFLGHGYRFFAPNPGPSHRVRYEVVRDDGTIVEGVFPNLDDQWPRLLYHRMFMISETVNASVSSLPSPDAFAENLAAGQEETKRLADDGHYLQAERLKRQLDEEQLGYERALRNRDRLLQAIAQRLAIEHQGSQVKLYLQEHLIPTPLDVELGTSIHDPELIMERPILEWTATEDAQ